MSAWETNIPGISLSAQSPAGRKEPLTSHVGIATLCMLHTSLALAEV